MGFLNTDVCGQEMFARCVAALDADSGAVLAYPRTRLFNSNVDEFVDYQSRLNVDDESAYARFRSVLEGLGLNNAINGVIRRAALLRTGMHRPFLSSDVVLLAELALHGRFVEIDDSFLYRRTFAEVNTMDMEALRQFWFPHRKGPLRYQMWRYMIALNGAILRARPGIKDTTLGVAWVLRQLVWSRRKLMEELGL